MTRKPLTGGKQYTVGGLLWHFYYNTNPDWIGFIPMIILAEDERPIAEQVEDRYSHGNGWKPFGRFQVQVGPDGRDVLVYPGDPPLRMWCECDHPNGERVQLYDSAWLRVIHKDGTHSISRID